MKSPFKTIRSKPNVRRVGLGNLKRKGFNMNKKVIANHPEEFIAWVNGKSVLKGYPKSISDSAKGILTWDEVECMDDWTALDTKYVFNDKYVDFRVALVLGQTIQWNANYNKSYEDWVDITEDLTNYAPDVLRIVSGFKYPIYKQAIIEKQIVKFTDKWIGTVVKGSDEYEEGYISNFWVIHTDTDIWKDVAFDEERGLYDKQLVWCWDNKDTHLRELRFYDVKYKKSYSYNGRKGGFSFDNYEPYEGPWPEWAIEAYKTLKD